MRTPNRPPSCDLPQEFYKTKTKLKPCPFCGFKKIFQPTAIPHKVHCYNCECYGPWYDRTGSKWNSIPRSSELVKLFWLADEVLSWGEKIIDTYNFPEDGLAMAHDFIKLQAYAAKLRKEMGE